MATNKRNDYMFPLTLGVNSKANKVAKGTPREQAGDAHALYLQGWFPSNNVYALPIRNAVHIPTDAARAKYGDDAEVVLHLDCAPAKSFKAEGFRWKYVAKRSIKMKYKDYKQMFWLPKQLNQLQIIKGGLKIK